jgi:hypothetical protein
VILTELFLIFLGTASIAVSIPAALRVRRHTPLFTAETWQRRMRSIAPAARSSSGRWIIAPQSSGAADRGARRALKKRQERRKQLLLGLVAAVPLTLALAVVWGGRLWVVHYATYALLALYVAWLVEERRVREQSLDTVRSLSRRRQEHPSVPGDYGERRA